MTKKKESAEEKASYKKYDTARSSIYDLMDELEKKKVDIGIFFIASLDTISDTVDTPKVRKAIDKVLDLI